LIGEAIAAAAHRLGADRDAVLARIGGPLGARARAVLAQHAAAGGKALRAEHAAIARTPVPPGLRGVHPTWIEAALAELPPRARAAVAAGGGDPTDVWLARRATAGFVAMRPVEPGPPRAPDQLGMLAAPELAAWLERVGHAHATATHAATPVELGARIVARHVTAVVRIQIATRLPCPIGRVVLAALRVPVDPCPTWVDIVRSAS
jgi:hypothetical protein